MTLYIGAKAPEAIAGQAAILIHKIVKLCATHASVRMTSTQFATQVEAVTTRSRTLTHEHYVVPLCMFRATVDLESDAA